MEVKGNIIKEKTYKFALKVIKVYKLLANQKEYVISKQLLRSGTSIGANVEEAIGGQSRKDFIAKLAISYKEARESKYWINLLKDSDILDENIAIELLSDCEEICKIISKIISTAKQKLDFPNC